jgi:hypothetical protein
MFWPARYNWPMVSTFTVLERKTINDKKGRCDAHELTKVAAVALGYTTARRTTLADSEH